MSQLRMAVIGVGALGRHHARILAEMESVDLVAVADTSADQARGMAEQHGTDWTTDYQTLFDRIDAVSIVVPTVAHLEVASQFLSRRIPVLVEKPLAPDVAQARQLVEIAEQNDTLLQVGHVERFNPAMVTAKNHCGNPRYVRVERLSPYTFRSIDIGVVHDLMIHDLDLVLDLVGSTVRRVEAFGISLMGEHEDIVQAHLAFANGCLADLTASRVNPFARRAMQIWSFRNCVSADLQTREVTCHAPSDTLRHGVPPVERVRQPGADVEQLKKDVFGRFIETSHPVVPDGDALTAELSSFVDCVQQGNRPLVDGQDALRAVELADAVVEAVASHRWDASSPEAIGPFARISPIRKQAG